MNIKWNITVEMATILTLCVMVSVSALVWGGQVDGTVDEQMQDVDSFAGAAELNDQYLERLDEQLDTMERRRRRSIGGKTNGAPVARFLSPKVLLGSPYETKNQATFPTSGTMKSSLALGSTLSVNHHER